MNSTVVTIVETTTIDRFRYCLIGVPDVGLAGSIALSYSIKEQRMTEVGHLESEAFPPVIVIHNGDPKPPLRLYSKDDVMTVVSEIPIDPHLIAPTARSIVDWVKSKGVELLIALSGISVPNRLEIDVPEVYGVASSPSVRDLMKRGDIKVLEEGFVTGLHAVVMKESLRKKVPCIILLAQAHLQYPDPGAAASLISSINRLLGLTVETKELLAQEEELRLKLRALMQRTQEQMQSVQKGREQELPPMYL